MPENEITPDGEAAPETAKEKFERERLSRRQALKRLGMTSAMATFALFSVDDLARMVGQAMQQRAGDNKVAEQVAKEFQHAGVAFADTSGTPCSHCMNQFGLDAQGADTAYAGCRLNGSSVDYCNTMVYCPALNNAIYAYNGCCAAHCPPGTCTSPPKPSRCL